MVVVGINTAVGGKKVPGENFTLNDLIRKRDLFHGLKQSVMNFVSLQHQLHRFERTARLEKVAVRKMMTDTWGRSSRHAETRAEMCQETHKFVSKQNILIFGSSSTNAAEHECEPLSDVDE